MIKALNKDKLLVSIDNARNGDAYFCPICNHPLFQRRGEIRQPHFAHYGVKKGFSPCRDNWVYDMSDWHMEWQKRFPSSCFEKVVTCGEEKHIADVLINDTVVEFQHSAISWEVFSNRNRFYERCGYKVIWVFDFTKEFEEGTIKEYNCFEYSWASPKKLFREMPFKYINATIYFQFSLCKEDDCGVMERISGGYNHFTKFYGDRNCVFSISEFVASVSQNCKKVIPPKIEKPKAPDSLPNGKTIHELWKPSFSGMIVRNLFNNQEMLINGWNGKMNRQDNNPKKKIIGKYSQKGPDNRYRYSNYYPVWDDEKAIWLLKKAFVDKEYVEQKQLNSELSQKKWTGKPLTDLIRNKDAHVFYCEYNGLYYYLEYVNGISSYNAYEFSPFTGEIGEISQNAIVFKLREQPVWALGFQRII